MGRKRAPKRRHDRREKAPKPSGPPCPALLAWLSQTIPEEQLRGIASLDYMTDVPQHLDALHRVVRGDLSVLAPIGWHPQEVLCLERWAEGADFPESRHLARLFATTCLLVAAAEPENQGRLMSINETAVVAVESVIDAFPDRADELAAVIDRAAEGWDGSEEIPHLVLAKFLLREIAGAPPEELSALVAAAERLATSHRANPENLWRPAKRAYGWVLDLTVFDQRARMWRRLLDEALARLKADPATAPVAAELSALRERKE